MSMDSEEEDYLYREEVGSEEEYFPYNSGGDEAEDYGVEVELDCCAAASRLEKNYKILNEVDIKQLQENEISTIANALSVSRGVACDLLCRNNWNPNTVFENWFASGEDKPPKPAAKSAKRKSRSELCTICYEDIIIDTMISAACGHPFCPNCWKTYISISISDGPGCLTLSCPESDCKSVVGLDMVDSLASEDDQKKYHQFLWRSYVESNKARKWCPAPGCDLAIQFEGGETYEVICDCSYKFCWNCAEESHRPVDCETVAKWISKNRSEAENTTWILAYTKPCPKCHRAIEKNQGCNHMTCQKPCGFHFCWICLGSWKEHKSYDGCNKYREGEDEAKKRRDMAKNSLERYTHYFERWDSNDKSRKRAFGNLRSARNEHVEILATAYNETQGLVQFVVEAWDQIVECRRVLKWTYAYGYYLSLSKSRKMGLFEYLQGQAETALERLHHCAEKEMGKYLKGDCPVQDFKDFRSKVVGLISVTKTYFENLVRALENNLSEVESSTNKRRKGV